MKKSLVFDTFFSSHMTNVWEKYQQSWLFRLKSDKKYQKFIQEVLWRPHIQLSIFTLSNNSRYNNMKAAQTSTNLQDIQIDFGTSLVTIFQSTS